VSLHKLKRLPDVAAAVADALAKAGIRAVLTGGACATFFTDGAYQSSDLDFILEGEVRRRQLDEALGTAGFVREGDRYVSPDSPFFVEFPRGPLGIGRDLSIRPKPMRIGRTNVRALSATDSCRDRLAAFYHWRDRQSLETAVLIATRHRVNLRKIREWSAREGGAEGFDEFRRELARRRGHQETAPHLPFKPLVRRPRALKRFFDERGGSPGDFGRRPPR
jgi:hypothetical protein